MLAEALVKKGKYLNFLHVLYWLAHNMYLIMYIRDSSEENLIYFYLAPIMIFFLTPKKSFNRNSPLALLIGKLPR